MSREKIHKGKEIIKSMNEDWDDQIVAPEPNTPQVKTGEHAKQGVGLSQRMQKPK